jgi:hypothetical protein
MLLKGVIKDCPINSADIRTTMGYVETNLDDLRIIQLALK